MVKHGQLAADEGPLAGERRDINASKGGRQTLCAGGEQEGPLERMYDLGPNMDADLGPVQGVRSNSGGRKVEEGRGIVRQAAAVIRIH